MLSVRCPVCPVCLSVVCVTFVHCGYINSWTDQDETWYAGRPRPWPHCVRWGPSSPSPKGRRSPQFLAHICCGQMAARITMSLGMEVGLGPGDFLLDKDPAPFPKQGAELPKFPPCLSWPNRWMDQDGSWPQPRRLYVRWGPSPSQKRGRSPLPNFRPIYIVAKRLDASRCHLVWK